MLQVRHGRLGKQNSKLVPYWHYHADDAHASVAGSGSVLFITFARLFDLGRCGPVHHYYFLLFSKTTS